MRGGRPNYTRWAVEPLIPFLRQRTARELAELLDVSCRQVVRWRNGRVPTMTLHNADKAAIAFGLTLEDLER